MKYPRLDQDVGMLRANPPHIGRKAKSWYSFEHGVLHTDTEGALTQEDVDSIFELLPTTGSLWIERGILYINQNADSQTLKLGEVEHGVTRVSRAVFLKNPAGLTAKGERMYEHVKESYAGDPRAKEIAARTVLARASEGTPGLKKNPVSIFEFEAAHPELNIEVKQDDKAVASLRWTITISRRDGYRLAVGQGSNDLSAWKEAYENFLRVRH